jgi:hypothetical protein
MSYLDLAQRVRASFEAAPEAAIGAPAAVPPDEFNELTKKPAARSEAPTAALRAAYRQCFTLTVAEAIGAPPDLDAAQALHQQILRLTDDAGPLWADAVFADELRRFRAETGRCDLCGGLGHPLEGA